MTELALYVSPGACSRVPMIVLEEMNLDFEERLVRFMRGEHKQPEYLALNPKGKVPLLLVDGVPLSENVAIIRYLATAFPARNVLPVAASPMEAAQQNADLAFCSATLHPIVTRIRMPMFMADGEAAIASVRDKAMEAMMPFAKLVSDRLSTNIWWYENTYSAMDAYLNWVWFRITGAGFPETEFPAWADHYARMGERPAVKRALAREASQQNQLEADGAAIAMR